MTSLQPGMDSPRYDSTRQAWEEIWAGASIEQELEAVDYRRARRTIERYAAYLNKDDLIVEAGSGLGAVIVRLKQMGYRNVHGLDYAVQALQACHRHFPDMPLAAGDVHALPYADNSIDAYLSFGVLEHFEHGMSPALAEAHRVLKPGGILILTIPYPNIVNQLVAWRRKRSGGSVLTDDDFYESTYTRDKLVGSVRDAGFTILEAVPTSHSFTLWGLGGPFRAKGYYRTSALAEAVGGVLSVVLPWAFNFTTLVIARKQAAT